MYLDPYQVLGVSTNAPQQEIRDAYLLATHNSDSSAVPDTENLERYHAAYALIGTPARRASYNAKFHRWVAEPTTNSPQETGAATPAFSRDEVQRAPSSRVIDTGFVVIGLGFLIVLGEVVALACGWFVQAGSEMWGIYLIFVAVVVFAASFVQSVYQGGRIAPPILGVLLTWGCLSVVYYPQVLANPQSFSALGLLAVLGVPIILTLGSLTVFISSWMQKTSSASVRFRSATRIAHGLPTC
jgi:hypothetical protein